jgi:valyl-tRNA synthetase
MRRVTLCPFFRSEKRLSISCEDTVRQFYCKHAKEKQMANFCDSYWETCRYAIALNNLYERMDHMKTQQERDLAAMTHLAEARKKENDAVRQQLGYMNARNKSLEMMLGYLCDKFGVSEIDTNEMAEFFGQYTVNWKQSGKSTITIEKVKKNGR